MSPWVEVPASRVVGHAPHGVVLWMSSIWLEVLAELLWHREVLMQVVGLFLTMMNYWRLACGKLPGEALPLPSPWRCQTRWILEGRCGKRGGVERRGKLLVGVRVHVLLMKSTLVPQRDRMPPGVYAADMALLLRMQQLVARRRGGEGSELLHWCWWLDRLLMHLYAPWVGRRVVCGHLDGNGGREEAKVLWSKRSHCWSEEIPSLLLAPRQIR